MDVRFLLEFENILTNSNFFKTFPRYFFPNTIIPLQPIIINLKFIHNNVPLSIYNHNNCLEKDHKEKKSPLISSFSPTSIILSSLILDFILYQHAIVSFLFPNSPSAQTYIHSYQFLRLSNTRFSQTLQAHILYR